MARLLGDASRIRVLHNGGEGAVVVQKEDQTPAVLHEMGEKGAEIVEGGREQIGAADDERGGAGVAAGGHGGVSG